MKQSNLIAMDLVSYKVTDPSKPKIKSISGIFFTTTNLDGSINNFILTNLNKTKVHNNRIPFSEGNEIHFDNKQYYIDFVFIDPSENSYVARVSQITAA